MIRNHYMAMGVVTLMVMMGMISYVNGQREVIGKVVNAVNSTSANTTAGINALKQSEEHIFAKFIKFNKKYHKEYSSFSEMQAKFIIFKANYLAMLKQRHNRLNESVLGLSKFMDVSQEEFDRKFLSTSVLEAESNDVPMTTWNTTNPPLRNTQATSSTTSSSSKVIRPTTRPVEPTPSPSPAPAPEETTDPVEPVESEEIVAAKGYPSNFDWRQKGVVADVLDQQECGSCWSFSALVSVEGAYARKYGRVYNISPQQVLDCNGSGYSCSGGTIMAAMSYLKTYRGMPYSSYPYENKKGQCRYESQPNDNSTAKVEEYYRMKGGDENDMVKMLYDAGPLAININAMYFKYYKGGILYPDKVDCPDTVNHGVALVGYGVMSGIPYWIIKNSWGPSWGEQGYMRIYRGDALCGITSTVVAATIV